jgi:NADPH-dependent 2,4-dienoyl-CoA reductase/sulfur reductase-like enzyme
MCRCLFWLTHPIPTLFAGIFCLGCAAAISAGEMGANVLLIEPSAHVGGMMTEGGIGLRDGKVEFRLTDPRNSQIRWGILNAKHYGVLDPAGTTIWQPDNYVGEESFLKLLEDAGVEVRLNIIDTDTVLC